MNQIKISIVMPVHNTGEYLRDSLDSIFYQSFETFEIICVDDASEDQNTKEILQEYESKYENMQVIRLKTNVGSGEARNIGFLRVKGEYTIFLDADDIFADSFLEKMYHCICENEADICVCGHDLFYLKDGKRCYDSGWMPVGQRIQSPDKEEWFLYITTAAWDKLCKTSFLKENNIYFQSLVSCNDVLFSCRAMINAKKICCIEDMPLISYRIKNPNQISANRNPLDLYDAVMLLYETEQKGNENLLGQWLGALLIRNGIWESKACGNRAIQYKYYRMMRKFFVDNEIKFESELLEAVIQKMKGLPDEFEWFCDGINFSEQIRLFAQRLKKEIYDVHPLFLWGLGARGDAFQQFCREQNIKLDGVSDIKNINIGIETEYGNKVISTEYVLKGKGLIIASNSKVYDYLSKKNIYSLNLEKYCFL